VLVDRVALKARLDVNGKSFTFNLERKVPWIVCNRHDLILIFKDVSRQKDSSRIDPKETMVTSTAHAESVPINFDRPCGIFSGFLIHELGVDWAKAIDIELLQVCSNVSRRPTRRKNGE